ncbi:OLC1v1015050C1 [Oldenlandia corymbosa var. corymbosa]|uniref:OLC1v1015050C1 n=1 Tax=Oldenlandia corymbosa var. corymbosa TaxID=529605 RepID=A0AAV1E2Q4_OLDCO|nr:OLC1v1015050C1 [Oldenlandia corymbosa var. corymbosa]
MVGAPSASSSLKEYLKKYQDGNDEVDKKKKKKKKVKSTVSTGVLVVDEDPKWQKPVNIEEEEVKDSADEEKPQIEEDIEVKRMKRLEMIRSRRPFGAISEDGSGWVSVSDTPKLSQSTNVVSDSSPPRRKRADTPSPEHNLKPTNETDLDLSPPRKSRARNDTPSPKRYVKPSSRPDDDLSPPRKRGSRHGAPSPDRRKPTSGADLDLSPPRKRGAWNDTPSPDRERDRDLSPPRKRRARADTPSPSPSPGRERRSTRAAEDLSPPRQKQKRSRRPDRDSSPSPETRKVSKPVVSDIDMSPPRRVRQGHPRASPMTDISPPRKSKNNISVSDEGKDAPGSPGLDLSPPRKRTKEPTASSQRAKTGLVTGQDIKEEIDRAKKEDFRRFKEMDPSISGRGAEPVYRDKVTGERMTKEQFLKSQKKEEKPKEIKLEWGQGLAQKREAKARLQELEREKDKPFARSRDDPDLDKMLKERVRFGDPMAHLVKKKHSEPLLEDLGNDEKMKESGFIIPQDVPSHSWIRRGVHPPDNRYGIKPGRHWDGVDRSNGFEKQMFKRMNEKQASEREAYLWSVSDM